MKILVSFVSAFLALGCGPIGASRPGGRVDGADAGVTVSDSGTGGGGGGDGGTSIGANGATLSGRVWAPGNAPGSVPSGHEIPVFSAIVRITDARLPPIPEGAYCERCENVGGNYALTDHAGNFTIRANPGTWWLTIGKGQFRIEHQITVAASETRTLESSLTTLPSAHDPQNGRFIPRVAIASGSYDHLEDVFGKMDIGAEGGDGRFSPNEASSQVHFYRNGGLAYSEMGTLTALASDLSQLMRYHVIFIPCSGEQNAAALRDQNVLRNLRSYVDAGGKLYVTDWSGEWMDNVFPAFVTLASQTASIPGFPLPAIGQTDTPATAYDAANNTWNVSQFGDADGTAYDSNNAEAVDSDLRTWLQGQRGPNAHNDEELFNAMDFDVVGSWNAISSVNAVSIGVDSTGQPVSNTPKVWVRGGVEDSSNKQPLTVTFEPTGCGRVLYSTYHTTEEPHRGLAPQERVLLYLIMEIGICTDIPVLI